MDALWCETCGEAEQEVHTEHAGLCGDCFGASLAQVIEEATGDRFCGHPYYLDGKVVGLCLQMSGTEHVHGVITGA